VIATPDPGGGHGGEVKLSPQDPFDVTLTAPRTNEGDLTDVVPVLAVDLEYCIL
jgi:hypothetical protein